MPGFYQQAVLQRFLPRINKQIFALFLRHVKSSSSSSIAAASTGLSKHLKECETGEEIDPLLLLLLLLTPVKERLEGFTVEEEE
jgi:hypothetical protein